MLEKITNFSKGSNQKVSYLWPYKKWIHTVLAFFQPSKNQIEGFELFSCRKIWVLFQVKCAEKVQVGSKKLKPYEFTFCKVKDRILSDLSLLKNSLFFRAFLSLSAKMRGLAFKSLQKVTLCFLKPNLLWTKLIFYSNCRL